MPSAETPSPAIQKTRGSGAIGMPGAASRVSPLWLWAAVTSLLVAGVLLLTVHLFIQRQLQRHPERFNTYPLREKLVGLAVQRQVFASPDLLPVYGSSELTEPQENRADNFFRAHPTGFGAFLLGNPGETCLMVTTKLAAAEPANVRGKRAVIFLSPGWFIAPELDHPGFGANFSPLHGGVFAFENHLSTALKQDIARRLLDYPDILVRYPLLKAAFSCLAANTGLYRALLTGLRPIGAINNGVRRAFDYARLGVWWWREGPSTNPPLTAPAQLQVIDWDARLQKAAAVYGQRPPLSPYCMSPRSRFDDDRLRVFVDSQHPDRSADDNFNRWCARSKEWTDYRLMLRTAQELGISVMVVCQPINVNYSRLQGVDSQTCAGFYQRLTAETAAFHVPLLTFPKQGEGPRYFQDANHPSALMWLLYDRALDTFYHQTLSPRP